MTGPGTESAPMAEAAGHGALAPAPEDMRCTWHPDRSTGLRCLRCERPMCVECARQHPVGMRCRECARDLRPTLYKVSGSSLAVASIVGLVSGGLFGALAFLAVFAFGFLGILFGFFLGGAFGGIQAELVGRAAGRKRGRALQRVALAGMVAGALAPLALVAGGVVSALAAGRFGGAAPTVVLLAGTLAYLAAAAAAIRARLA